MSVYKGTSLLAGVATNTISNSNYLLDWKWSDHIVNSMEWLRSDTFSWQSGGVYTAVYNHLLADMTSGAGAELKTETIGSYTVSYYLASDGHKIVMPDQEATVSNIYSESGVAWYYVLDQTNQRFKLPRSSHGNIVEKYQNGTDWYMVYSDGWCEQGGQITWTSNPDTTITFLKTFRDTNYQVYGQVLGTSKTNTVSISFYNKAVNSVIMYPYSDNRTANWIARGYLSSYPSNGQYKYLYFYVGEYSQSATEQTAGLNAELFNGKLDLDMGNMNPTASVKKMFVGWGMPDFDSGVAITSPYTPTVDGIIVTQKSSGYSTSEIKLTDGNIIARHQSADSSGSNNYIWAFAKSGKSYTMNGTSTFYPFIGA